ncbi:hypothetical protein ACFSFY_12500 [Sporosarcina siberiensis]|uniref:AAA+ ATPase domain-containing protein n=1 Tax=Sporosarcina siberiensis TaxID=1365606 RepID=A0ABW4SHT7_9BACL
MVLNRSFKTSVNVKFDIGNDEFVQRYLPTPSHAESLIGLAEGFLNKGGNSAHIMVGPYGSGKSLVATIMANFVSKAIKKREIKVLVDKFSKVHQEVYQSLSELTSLNRTYIPITLSGSEGQFSDAIITSIINKLKLNGIEISLPDEKNKIIKIIADWLNEYPSTYKEFTTLLKDRNSNPKLSLQKIEKGDIAEIKWFKIIYPSLTAGAEFQSNTGGVFIEKIELILDVLEKENIGIFIIYDEFGRFLQNLDHQEVYKAMQDIQDLAEIANRVSGYLQVLLISHKSMSQYMFGFTAEYQSEFQRIEKRFSTYFVESDTATYYRIAEQYSAATTEEFLLEIPDFKEIVMDIRSFNLFGDLNQQEIEKVIVEGAYPIHPVTLYLLPRISKVFGQNERTLFTFLESEDTGGLMNHIRRNFSYYYPDNLFEFFFSKGIEGNQNDEALKSLKVFKRIEKNLPKNEATKASYKILKLITLWEISHSNTIYRIDSDLISFAIGMKKIQVEKELKELSVKKFIRFNRILNQWELMEGSSVVIDELIDSQLSELRLSQDKRMPFLSNTINKRYFLASAYNDIKDMTRFMKVSLINSKEFLKSASNEQSLLHDDADGYIYLILLDSKNDYKQVLEKVKSIENSYLIFSILTEDFKSIQEQVDQEMAISNIISDKNLLSEHRNLEIELNLLHEELLYEISSYLDAYFTFKSNVVWIYQGEELHLSNEVDLEDKISNIMWDNYSDTPIVMNDSVNRMNVVGIQRTSLYKVLDGVLKSYDQPNLEIIGQGPDYLIYATVIKNNDIDLKSLDSLSEEKLASIRETLLKTIEESPEGNLERITEILSSAPYGIRKPLIPLFVVILLRDKWDQLMFYRNSMYVPALEAEKIYEMFNEPCEYSYEFHDYSVGLNDMMNTLERHLKMYISEYVLESIPLIRVSSGLLNWLRALPRHTQITNNLSDELLQLKEVIRKSEVTPLASIEYLQDKYGNNIEGLKALMSELRLHHKLFVESVKNYLLEQLDIESFIIKDDFLKEYDAEVIIKNRLLSSLKQASTIEEMSMIYIGTELVNWSDTTYELFLSQVKNDLISLDDQDVISDDVVELTYNNKYKKIRKLELSTKSNIIYDNVNRMIKNAGKTVPREEIDYIIYKLINEYIE